jgi:uncharacterized membrane protein
MNDAFIYVLTTNGLLFGLSIIFWQFPPKKINSLYGYRTHKTMQNQDIWDFANIVFHKNLMIYSFFSLVAGIFFAYLAPEKTTWQPMVLLLLSILVSIVKTERALKDNFTDEGKRLKK